MFKNWFRKQSKENVALKVWAAVALAATIVVNALANILPIGGNTTGEVSDAYPNLFAPAGVTFSIWSLIYLLLIGYAVYQFASVRARAGSKLGEQTFAQLTPLFIATSVLNIAWMFAWQYHVLWLSVLLMLGILFSLIKTAAVLRKDFNKKTLPRQDYVLVRLPFSVYFGWITVATIANITTFLVSTGWEGGPLKPAAWLAVVLVVGAVIALAGLWRNRDAAYGAVFIWAYGGILIKHMSESGHNGAYPSAIVLLSVLIAVLGAATLFIAAWPTLRKEK